jgi:hypothetical protein
VAQVDDAALNSGVGLLDSPQWRLTGGFDWHEWDGDVVVRVRRSASTLALSPAGSAVLIVMQRGPRSMSELALLFATDTQDGAQSLASAPDDAAALRSAVADTLHQLEALGLAERTHSL